MNKKIKILNCYAGLGGNRKLWPDNCVVTAVELNEEIANLYQQNYPNDTVIIADAHKYAEKHYTEFDFVWLSPPCPSHSKMRRVHNKHNGAKMPDTKLWSEILFFQEYGRGLGWVIENVEPYYDIFIHPTAKIGRHLIWSNFKITKLHYAIPKEKVEYVVPNSERFGFSLKGLKLETRKDTLIRNLVDPEIGLHILNCFINNKKTLFE